MKRKTVLDPNAGLTVTEIIKAALEGTVKGMYIMGENPFLSDPNVNKVRKGLAALDFLVVQDIFLTETAEFADVILPAASALEKTGTYTNTDRRVQVGRPAMQPPGQARPDLEIICDLATRFGLPMQYESPSAVFDEMVALMPSYAGLSHTAVEGPGKVYPLDAEHPDGREVLFGDAFATEDGRAHLVPAEWLPPDELPDEDYPLILTTGRILQHWHLLSPPGARVLEVGSGSGYQAAILAEMGMRVYSIEIVAPLAERARAALDAFVAALADYSAATIREPAVELYAPDAYFNDQIKELTGAVAIGDYLARSAEMLVEPRIEVQGTASQGGDHYVRWLMTFRTEPDDPLITARGITHVRFGADGKVIFHADLWDVSGAVWERVPVVGTVIRKARARL